MKNVQYAILHPIGLFSNEKVTVLCSLIERVRYYKYTTILLPFNIFILILKMIKKIPIYRLDGISIHIMPARPVSRGMIQK